MHKLVYVIVSKKQKNHPTNNSSNLILGLKPPSVKQPIGQFIEGGFFVANTINESVFENRNGFEKKNIKALKKNIE